MGNINETLVKNITRKINGVIKADQNEEETIITELSEYVVTEEVRKHMARLFDRYVDSINTPTEDMGVWISGFFGSGKSHFLKMLGHIFKNDVNGGKKSIEYFIPKLKDGFLEGNIEKAGNLNTDVILFNIDNTSDQDTYQNKDTIAVAFLKRFNEYLGFSRDDIKTASFERKLWLDGRFEEFKNLFLEETDEVWEDSRRNIDFIYDDFLDVIEEMEIKGFGREAAENWLAKESVESINAESFCEILQDYLNTKAKDQRIIFLVDEVGQYIGDNSQIMLNLQTLVEQLGTRFKGRVWVGVTSQQDIGSILEDNNTKTNDFSKIQDRFKTILPLSSGNIDEVIKKRLLEKKDVEKEDLENFYEKKRIDIQNLINFDGKGSTLKLYDDKLDFAETYPFVGYQFNLLQKVFEKVRNMKLSGQHMSRGERSLLSSFQEAGIRIKDKEIGALVPFNYFYESIDQFLEDNARRPINQAKKDNRVSDFGVEVLKLLFLLKGIEGVESNINNLTSFMIDSVDCDRIELEKEIKKALSKLEHEVLIQKDGDNYYFLTNEEQDINKEISREDIDLSNLYTKLDEYIFGEIYDNKNIVSEITGNKYGFSRRIDEYTYGKQGEALNIVVLTPNADDYGNELMLGNRQDYELIVKLPDNIKDYLNDIKQYLKVEAYIRRKKSLNTREVVNNILDQKQRENRTNHKRIRNEIEMAISNAEVYIKGSLVEMPTKEARKVIDKALQLSINNIFSNAGLIKNKYDEKKIRNVLDGRYEIAVQLMDIQKDMNHNINKEALEEVLNRIKRQSMRGQTVTLKSLVDYYLDKPYGWDLFSVNGLVAELWVYKLINIEEGKENISSNDELKEKLTKSQSRILERIVISIKEEIDRNLITKVNNILKEVFDSSKEITLDDPKSELINFIRIKIKENRERIEKCKINNYPGIKVLKEWEELLEEALDIRGKSEKALRDFLEIGEELKENYYKESQVRDFLTGVKKNKFKDGRDKIKEIKNYNEYFEKITKIDSFKALEEIIESKDPYDKIKDIDGLIEKIDKAKKEIYDEERKLLEEKAKKQLESQRGFFNGEGKIFEIAERETENFLREVKDINDNTIFNKGKKLENIKSKIDRELDILKEKEAEEKKKQRVKLKKVNSTRVEIETEDEVNKYINNLEEKIAKLKKDMLEAIRNNKIVDVE